MSIGISQIIVLGIAIAILLGSGYLGIYIFRQNPQFKKYLTTKNVIIISLAYIVIVSFISGKNAAYGFGAILTPYIITVVNSLFRNKLKFKKTFAYYRILKNSRSRDKIKSLYYLWIYNKKFNNFSILENILSIFFISLNSIKKYGFKMGV